MAKRAPQKRGTTNKRKRKKNQISFELTGIFFLFAAVIGLSKLGFAGILMANFFRFFFGELYTVSLALFGIYGLYLLIMGKEPRIKRQYLLGGILVFIAAALFLHAGAFHEIVAQGGSVFHMTLTRFLVDARQSIVSGTMGGGMLGAVLYTGSYFLVSQWGTYALVGLLAFLGMCVVFGFDTHDVMSYVRKAAHLTGTFFHTAFLGIGGWLKRLWDNSEKPKRKTSKSTNKQSVPAASASGNEEEVAVAGKPESWLDLAKNRIAKGPTEQGAPMQQAEGAERQKDMAPPEPIQLTIDSYQSLQQQQLTEQEDRAANPAAKTDTASPAQSDVDEGEEGGGDLDFVIKEEAENRDYQLPPASLLDDLKPADQSKEYGIIERNVKKLEETFASFGVDAKVTKANLGPAVTKYEVQPAVGVKVSKIVGLSDDLALALAAKDIRIEAPIPGKSFIGIEVPNSEISTVSFRNVMEGQQHTDKLLEVPLGRDISGVVQSADLTKMPHLLIAGATGSGKSVSINGIITSILMKAKPNEVKLMMIDPKMVELNVYNGIPHLLTPVVTNPRKAAQALHKVVSEMERRYELFAGTGMRNIDGYNNLVREYNIENGENNPLLPYIVVIVDELADLMMVASNDVEDAITRLAQMARAAGIHMILATQRPSVDVITGIIKANVPSRIAFAVSSSTDSRTILDGGGAEKLLGRGDMLFRPMGENKAIRVQGAYISDEEVERVVSFVKTQQEPNYVEEMMQLDIPSEQEGEPEDELFAEAVEFVRSEETASISKLQRRFRIGYNRAARIIDEMEARGIVGPADGSKPRKVNISEDIYPGGSEIDEQA